MTNPALAGTCSAIARERAEPMLGTAPEAAAWLVVEQPGPWGRDALTQSHLDAQVATVLAARTEQLPVRVLLARRPGYHADLHRPRRRQVWLASAHPDRTWLATAGLDDPGELLDPDVVDLDALAVGSPAAAGPRFETVAEPMLFVCTNARRDRCCALRGRPLAAALAARYDARVWECSHLGGHRFSPTALVLPHGLSYGRLTEEQAATALDAAADGQVVTAGYRGRSCWSRPGQVAEAEVRLRTGEHAADAVVVEDVVPVAADEDGAGRMRVHVRCRGHQWQVTVSERTDRAASPASCGKEPAVQPYLVAMARSGTD